MNYELTRYSKVLVSRAKEGPNVLISLLFDLNIIRQLVINLNENILVLILIQLLLVKKVVWL